MLFKTYILKTSDFVQTLHSLSNISWHTLLHIIQCDIIVSKLIATTDKLQCPNTNLLHWILHYTATTCAMLDWWLTGWAYPTWLKHRRKTSNYKTGEKKMFVQSVLSLTATLQERNKSLVWCSPNRWNQGLGERVLVPPTKGTYRQIHRTWVWSHKYRVKSYCPGT